MSDLPDLTSALRTAVREELVPVLRARPVAAPHHPDFDPLLSLAEAAAYVAMSAGEFRDLCARREIAVVRRGERGRYRVRLSVLNGWARRNTINARRGHT